MSNQEAMYKRMTEEKVSKLVLKLATPTILAMLTTNFYNLADTFFVSRISTTASAAVGVTFSIMIIIQSIGFFFGQGAANNVSALLGQKDNEKASRLFSTAFFSCVALTLVVSVLGIIFIEPFVMFLGSSETVKADAAAYGIIILIGAPWLSACFTLNNLFRAEGRAHLGAVGMMIGSVLNIVLDPIFIWGFNMGIRGAAWATILSQLVSFFIFISHFIRGRSQIKLSIKLFTFDLDLFKKVSSLGLPSLLRSLMMAVTNIVMNTIARGFGDAALAAMSIVSRVANFCYSVLIGFGQGFQPVSGYNWGAGRKDRVKEAFYFCIKVGVIAFIIIGLSMFFGCYFVMAVFSKDPEVVQIGGLTLRFLAVAMPFNAVAILGGMMLQSTQHGTISSVLSVTKQGGLFIPIIIILSLTSGLIGIQLSQAVSDILNFFVTAIIVRYVLKKDFNS